MGEHISAKWLVSQGFTIIEQNYTRKWGEIDIVARETVEILHFVEVKTVSYETGAALAWAVSHETWRPEENVHQKKQDRFKRAIQTWLSENKWNKDWQIDIVTVRMVPREKIAKVKLIPNVIFQ